MAKEEVIFKSEQRMDRSEIATYLRKVADNLDGGESIKLTSGSQNATLSPPASPTFEVKAEHEGDERSVEFELEWHVGEEGDGGDSGLHIE